MYKFIDMDGYQDNQKGFTLFFDNQDIKEIIPDMTIIDVIGRDQIERKLYTYDGIKGRNGSIFTGYNYKHRRIKVIASIDFKDTEDFRYLIEKLKMFLSSEHLKPLIFSDEKDLIFDVIYNNLRVSEEYQNSFEVEIEFYSPSSFKRTKPVELKFSNNKGTVQNDSLEYKLYEIKGTITADIVEIINLSKGVRLKLKDLNSTGSLVITRDEITINGVNSIQKLDESISIWKTFPLKRKDEIEIKGLSNFSFKIEGLRL
ncbi:MAG: phage tail family protein [Tissierellia bacterium]|nr:phage tail family protein [Tissierellia bacterium]